MIQIQNDMVDKNKKYITRSGQNPKGLTFLENGSWGYWLGSRAIIVSSRGNYDPGNEHPYDLIEIKERHVGWINVYRHPDSHYRVGANIFTSRHEANSVLMKDKIACIKIEYKEGEGL